MCYRTRCDLAGGKTEKCRMVFPPHSRDHRETHLQKHLEFNVQLLNTVEVTINYVAQWKQLPREVLSSPDSIVHNLMNEVKHSRCLNGSLTG